MHKIHSPLLLTILVFISLLLTSASPAWRISGSAHNDDLNLQQPQIDPPALWQVASPVNWFPLKPIQKPMSTLLQVPAFQAGRPATTLTVGTNCTYQNLQAAVTAAISGTIILVEGKTWTGADATVDFPDKSLTLRGGYDSNCINPVTNSRTKLDASGTDSVFDNIVLSPATKRTIEVWNFEITGGNSPSGGGVYAGTKVNWYFTNTIIHHNSSYYGGGIAMSSKSSLALDNTDVYSNTASDNGGGIYCEGTYTNTFVSIFGSSNLGYAMPIPGPPWMKGFGNHANGSGGGAYLNNCALDISDSLVWYNSATQGGGIFAASDSTVQLDDVDVAIKLNTAVDGAGVYLGDSHITFYGGQLIYNTASRNGGGLYATGSSTYGYIQSGHCQSGQCNQISQNSAGDSGGGIYLGNLANIAMFDKIYMDGNHADGSASAIYARGGAQMQIRSSVIIRGSAPDFVIQLDNTGGAPTIWIGDSTIADNTSNATAIFGVDPTATLNAGNLIVWGNAGANLVAGSGSAMIMCSILQSAYTGNRNQVADPLFVNAAAGNYHIQVFSPAVDHCGNGTNYDVDDQARPYHSQASSTTPYDAGADEVYTSILFMPLISK